MAQPLKLLIVEDNAADAELLLRQLRRNDYEPEWKRVDTEADFLSRLDPGLDLIISDYEMPQFSGFRAVQLLKESGLDVPLILVSGTIGEEIAVQAMKEGAVDYLLKDRLARLGPAVARALEDRQLRRVQKRADEELRIAHAQVQQLLAHSPVVIYGLKLDGSRAVPRFFSENITTILGFTPAECLRGDWWLSQVHPEDRTRILGVLEAGLAGTGYTTEYRLRHKDGTYRWVEDRNRVLPGGNLAMRETVGIWTDITERKRAEEIVRQAAGDVVHRRRKTAVVELAIVAAGGVALYGLAVRFGWFTEIDDWLVAQGFRQWDAFMVASWFVTAGLAVFAFRRLRESQSELSSRQHLQAALRLLHDELDWRVKQRTVELVTANDALRTEIAGRQQAQQATRESEERFRQIAENIHEVFWMTDFAKQTMLYISPAYEVVWGRTCESLYQSSLNWVEALHPEDRARVMEAAVTKQAQGKYDETYRIVRPDGTLRWIHDRAFPIRGESGEVYRLVGVAEDITERKGLEAQFFRAQRVEAIGMLASGIAHDMNNILAPILMSAPLLRMGLTPERLEKTALTIETSAQRGANLVRQLLTFGRGVEGDRQVVQLRTLLHEITKISRQTFPKNITVAEKVPKDLWPLVGDVTQLHQVLLNLCVNARDAMPQGGTLTITAEEMELDESQAAFTPGAKPGPYVLVRVTDTGTGIPAEIMDRIFDPFFTTKEAGKGTGLGLSTVIGIVKSHGGFVNLQSEMGRGSAFQVYLPALPDGKEATGAASEAAVPHGSGELILVVDDEEKIREITRDILVRYGYKVIMAKDGAEATMQYALHREEITAVITDLDMPLMDGVTLIQVLKKMNPAIAVLVSSGVASTQSMANRVAELEFLGVRVLLKKPYTVEKILRTLSDLLAEKKAQS